MWCGDNHSTYSKVKNIYLSLMFFIKKIGKYEPQMPLGYIILNSLLYFEFLLKKITFLSGKESYSF